MTFFRALDSLDMVCTAGCTLCASGAVVAGSQNAFSRPASHSLRKSGIKEIQVCPVFRGPTVCMFCTAACVVTSSYSAKVEGRSSACHKSLLEASKTLHIKPSFETSDKLKECLKGFTSVI